MSDPMQRPRPWVRPALVGVLSLFAVLADAGLGDTGVRTAAVVAFLALGPGLGLIGILGIRDGWREAALAIGLSLAVDVLVVIPFEYARDENVSHPLAVLVGIAVAGAAAQLAVHRPRRRRRRPHHEHLAVEVRP